MSDEQSLSTEAVSNADSTTDEIVIVSGLPRSGTSLMMQMLAKGGLQPLTDQIRSADDDNPKGYFEFERVKKIKTDQTWLPDARGKVVKMISQLLYDLPDTETYKVIFMRRDLDEIIRSQEKMLQNRGLDAPNPGQMKTAFQTHLDKLFTWLDQQTHIDVIQVSYNDILAHPNNCIANIADFLAGHTLDSRSMTTAIEPNLYRNREG